MVDRLLETWFPTDMTTTRTFIPCPECANENTTPPYVGEDGWEYEGWYCEKCGLCHDENGRRVM